MSQAGLSYEQAPPFGLPLRFFLTAPLFLLLAAGAALLWASDWTASRWSLASVALTHLLTLGFLGQVMMGALLQMLPVVLGSPVPWPRVIAGLGHLGLTLGTLLFIAGLSWSEPPLIVAGMVALAVGWLPFLAAAAVSLLRARTASTATLYPMRKAWFSLALTVTLGIWLGGAMAGLWRVDAVIEATTVHATWGLLGWVTILIMGVAYQVVPMLQLTPAYPPAVVAWLTWTLFGGALLYSLSVMLLDDASQAMQFLWLPIMGALAVFASVTLWLLHKRRRKLADTTLNFWRLAMLSLLALATLIPVASVVPDHAKARLETMAGLLFLLGFAVSVVNGMLYKIVPFLAWFHLQTQTKAKAGTIPNMKEFIPDAAARRQLHLHLTALLLLLPTPWLPPTYSAAGLLLLAASAWLLWRNLLACTRLFKRYGGRLN